MRWLTWPALDAYRDLGLLILRVGLGLMFVWHGWPKITGGPARWARLGTAMESLGIDFAPTFWGFCAAASECFGGALLALGLATRPVAALMAFTMFVAGWNHHVDGDGFSEWSHAAEDGIAFLALVLLGPGRYAVDARIR